MERVRVKDVATIIRGVSYKKEQAVKEYEPGYLPLLRANNISGGSLVLSDLVYVPSKLVSDSQHIKSGDILITMSSGSKSHVGKVALAKADMEYSFGAFCAKISPDHVLPSYLFYLLCDSRFRHHIESQSKGTNINNIKQSYVMDYEITLPPLSEQERIVARIEELFSQLDAGVDTLKKTKAQLAVYRQAVLKEAFESITEFVPLGDVAERIFDGPFGSNLKTADYTDDGIRVVRLENIKNSWFDDSKKSFVTPEKYEKIKVHTVIPSDLIMSTFISESIKICQLPPHVGYAVNKADCVGIRLKPELEPRFLLYYLSSKQAYNELIHQVHGATRPRVNTKQIKAIRVPYVSATAQEAVICKIESCLSVCDNIEQTVETALKQADAMRQSILKDAFDGEMTI